MIPFARNIVTIFGIALSIFGSAISPRWLGVRNNRRATPEVRRYLATKSRYLQHLV